VASPAARGAESSAGGDQTEPAYERGRADHRPQRDGFFASEPECVVRAGDALPSGVNLDCDGPLANNEPDIVVDPADPLHAVVSSNDYDSCCSQYYTTFDGGKTWRTGNIAAMGPGRSSSDPVTAIDPRHGVVVNASLSSAAEADGGSANGHIVVSVSRDGGLGWDRPVVVAEGMGADRDADQTFHDKPWMVTDTNPSSPFYGRTYLTWTRFHARYGKTRESPIWLAWSDDGGRRWSRPTEISGSDAALCSGAVDGRRSGRCAADQASAPSVRPDGVLFVAFVNHQNEAIAEDDDGDDQYLVVRSDDGGATFSAPTQVAGLENGRDDYPRNVEGRPTLTGVQARVLFPGGNLTASPTTGELFLTFADNRAGRRGADPVTDLNVYLMTSTDGQEWDGPFPVATGPGDQWDPSVEINPVTGIAAVLYYDGNVGGRGLYGVSLAEGRPGAFETRTVAPTRSDLRNALFFPAGVQRCPRCTLFNGDYLNLAYGPDGRTWAVWTDMRQVLRYRGRTGHGQQVFVAAW
jgi:hypothetical protein